MEILTEEQLLNKLRELDIIAVREEMDQLTEETEKTNVFLEKISSEINGLIQLKNKLPDGHPQIIEIDIRLEQLYAERKPYDSILRNIFKRKIILDEKRTEIEKKTLELINEFKVSIGNEELFTKTYPRLAAIEKEFLSNTVKPNFNETHNNPTTNPQNSTTQIQNNDASNRGGTLSTIITIAIFVIFFLLLFGKYLF